MAHTQEAAPHPTSTTAIIEGQAAHGREDCFDFLRLALASIVRVFHAFKLIAGLLLAAAPAAPSPAPAADITRRSIAAVRLSAPPAIDGDLSDPVWNEAAKAERWVDWLNGNDRIDPTTAFLGYDERNLYVAFQAYDSRPEGIVARETKRGSPLGGDDFVDLDLDLFHTHKFGDISLFRVNPLGTKFARLAGGRATKLEWEGEWRAAARRVADGWTAEMAIPWAILNYPFAKGPTTVGINFTRLQQRTSIFSNWSNIGPDNQHPELAGHWTGVELPGFRPQLSLLPYLSPGWQERASGGLRGGLDLRSRLTPALTLVGTVHPDFQNVEGAVEGIDFSYGPRFVPDQRPFFQEGAGIYGIGGGAVGSYFYSSRIGELDTGAKLFGNLSPRSSVGLLAALDLGRRADWVLRGRHDFGPTSSLDLAWINRDDQQQTNRVFVLGENLRRRLWSLNGSWAASWLEGQGAGSAASLRLRYQSPRWFAQLAPYAINPRFRDNLGFIPFTGIKGLQSTARYSAEWRQGPLRSLSLFLNATDSHRYAGSLFQQTRAAFVDLQTRGDQFISLGWDGGRFEKFDDSVFSVNLAARISDPFRNYSLGYSWGRRAGAPITYITPSATYRFGEKLTVGLASSLLFHTENAQQHIFTFNYDFSPRQGIGGRLVAQTGGTGGYFSYRRSGYGGMETFLILGDPNAPKFRPRMALKLVWAM